MNFSPVAVQAAAGFVAAVRLALAPCAPDEAFQRGAAGLRARAAAVLWAGLDTEELNALARIAGHPLAPDLPEWMAGRRQTS